MIGDPAAAKMVRLVEDLTVELDAIDATSATVLDATARRRFLDGVRIIRGIVDLVHEDAVTYAAIASPALDVDEGGA